MAKLTEQEQQEIIRFMEAGKPLPDKYRFLLFEDKREVITQPSSTCKGGDKFSPDLGGITPVDKSLSTPMLVTKPLPISSLVYDWPGNFTPFAHQIKTTEFLVHHEKAFCLNDMGTGKTLSVLWAYDYPPASE